LPFYQYLPSFLYSSTDIESLKPITREGWKRQLWAKVRQMLQSRNAEFFCRNDGFAESHNLGASRALMMQTYTITRFVLLRRTWKFSTSEWLQDVMNDEATICSVT
jgi:hypothetical protein